MIDTRMNNKHLIIDHTYSIRKFLLVIFKRKKLILAVLFTTLVAVSILTFIQTPIYRATAKVLVEPEKYSESMLLFDINVPSKFKDQNWINSEIDILQSRPVASRVVKDFNLAENEKMSKKKSPSGEQEQVTIAIEKFQEKLQLECAQNNNVIKISYESNNPELAASVVNGVIDHYRKYRREIFDESENYKFYEEQLKIVEKKLNALEIKEESYKRDEDIILPGAQASILVTKLAEYEKSMTNISTRLIGKQAKLNIIREQLKTESNINIPSTEVSDSPSRERHITTLKNQLLNMEMEKDQLLQRFKPTYKKVEELDLKIAKTKKIIKNEIKEIIDQEQTSIKALQAEKQALEHLIEKINLEVKEFSKKDFQITQLNRGIDDNRELYSLLLKQREEARLSLAKYNNDVNLKVIDPAMAPRKPVKPKKQLNIILGAILGLLSGLSMAFIMEYFNSTVNTVRELRQTTGLIVLGSVKDYQRESESLE